MGQSPLSHYVGLVLREKFLAAYPFELDAFQLEAMDALDARPQRGRGRPDRLGQDRRGRVRRRPGPRRGGQGVLHHAPQGPVQPEVRRLHAPLRQRKGRAAHGGQLHQRRRPHRRHDHRGPAQHDLRRLEHAWPGCATWCSTRCTTSRTPTAARSGRRSSSTCRRRWTSCACRPPSPTPRSLPTGSAPCAGSTTAVIEERRPVPLHNLFLVGERRSERLLLLPTFVDERPNPRGIALTARRRQPAGGRTARAACSPPGVPRPWISWASEGLLPAIYFIFSRAGCDEAVRQCMREGGRLTTTRGTPPDPRHRRGSGEQPIGRGPGRARLRQLVGRPRSRLRRPPRRARARRSRRRSSAVSSPGW